MHDINKHRRTGRGEEEGNRRPPNFQQLFGGDREDSQQTNFAICLLLHTTLASQAGCCGHRVKSFSKVRIQDICLDVSI